MAVSSLFLVILICGLATAADVFAHFMVCTCQSSFPSGLWLMHTYIKGGKYVQLYADRVESRFCRCVGNRD